MQRPFDDICAATHPGDAVCTQRRCQYRLPGDGRRADRPCHGPRAGLAVEFSHELPGYTDFQHRLATFARVISFDKRGQVLSDRIAWTPSLDERMDDLDAVMKATGVKRAALFGFSEGASMTALFAATHPERVSHVVLYGGCARYINSEDYHFMFSLEQMLRSCRHWGTGGSIKSFFPALPTMRRRASYGPGGNGSSPVPVHIRRC
jgi:pimeloyl-ACP methyl ester carboxylesterase